MIKKESKNSQRIMRHKRVRKNISGTSEMPRLNVFRSNSNIFAQIIDDEKGVTFWHWGKEDNHSTNVDTYFIFKIQKP